jgi:hypothetical protein
MLGGTGTSRFSFSRALPDMGSVALLERPLDLARMLAIAVSMHGAKLAEQFRYSDSRYTSSSLDCTPVQYA